jgi:hypothetical protein
MSTIKKTSFRGVIIFMLVLINVIIIENGFVKDERWYLLLIVAAPALVVAATKWRDYHRK